MKRTRRAAVGDEAVSPVIAVILMVAITVVLAATVYLWVSGFGNQTQNVVQATFAAKAVDLPGGLCPTNCPAGDADASDDAVQVTYTAGQAELSSTEVYLVLDGQRVSPATAGNNGFTFGSAAPYDCTNLPSGASFSGGAFTWTRGATLYLWQASAADCGTQQSMLGAHSVQVVAKNQVLLDTQVEVHQ